MGNGYAQYDKVCVQSEIFEVFIIHYLCNM